MSAVNLASIDEAKTRVWETRKLKKQGSTLALDQAWEITSPETKQVKPRSRREDSKGVALTPAERMAQADKLKKMYNGAPFTIDPRYAKWMPVWDLIMMTALFFTAIATPYEVTFLDEGPCITPLFVINRVVDALFLIDMVFLFNLHYQDNQGIWHRDRCDIMCHYLKGWFSIDFLSILPFYLPAFLLAEDDVVCGLSGHIVTDLASDPGGTDALQRATQAVRVVKLLRMLKLARVFKASRVLKRLVADLIMTRLELTFAAIQVLQLMVVMIWICHLQACLFALVSTFAEGVYETTWVESFKADELAKGHSITPGGLYITALYWSIMTLTVKASLPA